MNGKRTNIIRKGLVAVSISGALVLGLGAVGASASNGAANSSDRSHESHDEHEKDHDGIGHGDNEDHVGDGRGHVSHGNGHGYGHGDGCDDHDDVAGETPALDLPILDDVALDDAAPIVVVPGAPADQPTDSSDQVIDVASPVTEQTRSQQPEVADAPEYTEPAVQPSSLVDNVNVPTDVPTDVVVTDPVTIPAVETSFAAPTEGETAVQPSNEPGTDGSADNLPMTGSSLVLIGLAAVLAAGGFVVLVARRRRDEVVA